MARRILKVYVSKENPWTLEKWHIRAAFRRSSFWVPDHAIKMNERPVSGPNAELEGKVFLVTVTVKFLFSITTTIFLKASSNSFLQFLYELFTIRLTTWRLPQFDA